jgi:hypothetical protein
VFLLDEVLKYNPDFDYHINNPWTTTLIKNFDGDITIDVVEYESEIENPEYDEEDEDYQDEYITEKDEEVRVIGVGNINFYTTQTGL